MKTFQLPHQLRSSLFISLLLVKFLVIADCPINAQTNVQDQAEELLEYSKEQFFPNKPDSILHYGKIVLELGRVHKLDDIIGQAHYQVGTAYLLHRKWDSALVHLEHPMVQLAKQDIQGKATHNSGYAYDQLGYYSSALDAYKRSLKIKNSSQDSIGIAKSHFNIGITQTNLGQMDSAIVSLQKSMELFETLQSCRDVVMVQNRIAIVYKKLRDFQLALEKYHEALRLLKDCPDPNIQGDLLNNIGNTLIALEDDSAIIYLDRFLKLESSLEDSVGIASALTNLGVYYSELGHSKIALDYLFQSLELKQRLEMKYYKINTLQQIALTYADIGKYTDAINWIDQALLLANEIDALEEHLDGIAIKKEILATFNRYDEAYSLSLQESQLADSLFSLQRQTLIYDLETKHGVKLNNQKLKLAESDLANSQLFNQWLITFICLLCIILFAGFLAYIIIKRKNKIINYQLDKIQIVNQALKVETASLTNANQQLKSTKEILVKEAFAKEERIANLVSDIEHFQISEKQLAISRMVYRNRDVYLVKTIPSVEAVELHHIDHNFKVHQRTIAKLSIKAFMELNEVREVQTIVQVSQSMVINLLYVFTDDQCGKWQFKYSHDKEDNVYDVNRTYQKMYEQKLMWYSNQK